MSTLGMERCEIVNDLLVVKWTDEEESYISAKTLRDACPCAECSGETDALGNFYAGHGRARGGSGYQLVGVKPVGYYALQPFWGDGHNAGIYRFELVRKLGEDRSGA